MISVQQAKDKRDIGMARATDRANREHEEWTDVAMFYLVVFSSFVNFFSGKNQFLAEDVIEFCKKNLFEAPDSRAWGSVFRRAAKEGVIRKVGYAPAKSSNLSPKTLWEAF